VLVSDLSTLTNLTGQNTLTAVVTILDAHHTLVAFFPIKKFRYHNVALLCTVVRERIRFTNLATVYVSVDIWKDNMVVTRTSTIVVGVPPIVRLQALPFRFDHQVLLLVDIGHSFVVFCLLIQLGCED